MATVFILDDDQIILDLLRTVLNDAGHTSVAAARPEALQREPKPDLIITDLVPLKAYHRAAALGWIASLREHFPGIPLLIISAHADAGGEPDKLGADAVIPKPFDVEVLLSTIDRLTGHIRKTP